MARPNRYFVPGYPQHVVQRGNNRQAVFFNDGDRVFYRDCLREACARFGCHVHAYVLMTNHVHILISPHDTGALPRTMQSVGRRYAQYVNWRRERTGTLWEGRYHAAAVDTDGYFFTCSRYIELNPVRAAMVAHPADYRWSSYAVNAGRECDPIVAPHPLYLALGDTPQARGRAYRQLFDRDDIGERELEEIRAATRGGWPIGGEGFRSRVELLCRRRARPLPKGGLRSGAGRPGKSIVSDPIDQEIINRL